MPNLMYQNPNVYMIPPTAEFTNLLGRDILKLAKTILSDVSPFDPENFQKLSHMKLKIYYGDT